MEVYTASFPPGYAGRLSSVVNITTRDGRGDRMAAEGRVNFLSAEAQLEGPGFQNTSWLLNVRKSHSSKTFSRIVGQHLPVSFYDGTVKVSVQSGGILKYDLSLLSSGDELRSSSPTEADYRWKNNALSITGFYLPTSRVFIQWLIYGSMYAAARDAKSSPTITSQSTSVSHYGLRCTSTIVGLKDQFDFGFELSVPSLDFDFTNRLRMPATVQSSFVDVSAWVRYQAQVGRTHVDYGLHSELAPLFEGSGLFKELQPRLTVSHQGSSGWITKASYGRFTQRVMTIGNEDEVLSIFEGWVKVPSYLPSQVADHFVVGYSGNLTTMTFVSTEAYYKSYGSVAVYNWNKASTVDPDYVQGTADSYGVEVMARSRYSWMDFYGAYSLSWAWIKNQGMTYAPRYDRRHHVNLLAVGHPTKSLSVTLKWEFGSGFPYSQSVGYIEHPTLGNSLPGRFEYSGLTYMMLFGAKNSARLPAYHRLDASVSYSVNVLGLELVAGIDLLNLYNNKNIFYFDRLTGQRVNMIPFYPSAVLSMKY